MLVRIQPPEHLVRVPAVANTKGQDAMKPGGGRMVAKFPGRDDAFRARARRA
jgi:hypothetical protein